MRVDIAKRNQKLLDKLFEEVNTLPITVVQLVPDRFGLVNGLMSIVILGDVLNRTTVLAEIVDRDSTRRKPPGFNL